MMFQIVCCCIGRQHEMSSSCQIELLTHCFVCCVIVFRIGVMCVGLACAIVLLAMLVCRVQLYCNVFEA